MNDYQASLMNIINENKSRINSINEIINTLESNENVSKYSISKLKENIRKLKSFNDELQERVHADIKFSKE